MQTCIFGFWQFPSVKHSLLVLHLFSHCMLSQKERLRKNALTLEMVMGSCHQTRFGLVDKPSGLLESAQIEHPHPILQLAGHGLQYMHEIARTVYTQSVPLKGRMAHGLHMCS